MKDFIKDYGAAIGPSLAFLLGILAIYIKALIDESIEKRKTHKKLSNLIRLIIESKPPPKYYPQVSADGFIHADQARNLTNISIYSKKLNAILIFIQKIEDDVVTNCTNQKIQQFHHIKFILSYLNANINELQDKKEEHDYANVKFSFSKIKQEEFNGLHNDYEKLLSVCENPGKHFNYITK